MQARISIFVYDQAEIGTASWRIYLGPILMTFNRFKSFTQPKSTNYGLFKTFTSSSTFSLGLTCVSHRAEDALSDRHDGVRGLVIAPNGLPPRGVLTDMLEEICQSLAHHTGRCAHLQYKTGFLIFIISILTAIGWGATQWVLNSQTISESKKIKYKNRAHCTVVMQRNPADLFEELPVLCGREASLDTALHRSIHQLPSFD